MKAMVLALTSLSLLSGCVVYANVSDDGGFWSDSELQHETRNLSLDMTDIEEMKADTGAGSLEIIGEAGRTRIDVVAEVYYRDAEDIQLSLEKTGGNAVLTADFASNSYRGDNPYINLTVRVPAELSIELNDGSGSIALRDVMGDLTIEDGSGSITIEHGGNVDIDDGSGSITVRHLRGDLTIEDGSGSIDIERVSGKVTIDDGSGGIDVRHVGDLKIIESGSGSLSIDGVGNSSKM
ncbi:DUF4097 family beta strand repeat-containing protein [Pseudidiomarina andamanensis]|uniref:Adhesin domain-containing protein n=1 Tax=Pseudidiomarina andamanensis TaxID=1940690 RepID=A0AA92ETP4_9GAMM|nr:hypothetical protein [Pseudidiomarina andamanensis]MDS0219013.1 DUF4097 domain-containing protein [Pseudidiomarina andamanensis]QGT96367.1 hypothetical protein D3795_09460 [Pseudidiomarina andamanensis]